MFTLNKWKNEYIFDEITWNDVNAYLWTFMWNLTAKTFRTYNAWTKFNEELNKLDKIDKNTIVNEINLIFYKIAKLCNHQKNVVWQNKKEKIDTLKQNIKIIKELYEKIDNKDKKKKLKLKLINLKWKLLILNEYSSLAINTWKLNYIDPRILFWFCVKNKIDIWNFYTNKLLDKFKWAIKYPNFNYNYN